MGLTHKPLALLVGDHHDAFFALPSDELRPLRTRAAKEFAKTRLGNRELPTALGPRLLTPSATSDGFVSWHELMPI
jgi:hypothetical protein